MPGEEHVNGAGFPAVVVVMVPFVAQGHLNQLLHLSRLVSAYNIPVHFVSTTHYIAQARSRHRTFNHLSDTSSHIHFHEFPTAPFTSPPPRTSIPFPTHLQPSFDSTLHLRHPVADLIRSLSLKANRVAVIHDVLMSYVVQDVKSIPNAETYVFQPPSAFYRAATHWENNTGRSFPVDQELMSQLPSRDGILSLEFLEFVKLQRSYMNFHVGELYDTSRVIESKFIEYLEREEISGERKIWAVGPFNPVVVNNSTVLKDRHKCLQWLDNQPANSVIYVSFGTTTNFTDDQIKELAIGLERSSQRFIWVVRPVDRGDDEYGMEDRMVEVPGGFEERVKGRGVVERRWAPQLEILGHSATGAFMTHCGWNSSIESISMGVPMATWPMHSDQPRNAFLITEVLGIGVAIKDWERREEVVAAEVVEEAVKTLLASREGEETRRRVEKLAGEVRRSVEKDGTSRKEMDSFISYILR